MYSGIPKDRVKPAFEEKYIKIFDLQYQEGKHYFNASRRSMEDLVAIKSEAEFKSMVPDAVTCVVILEEKGKEPVLLLTREYRYPAGRFLLSPPAGLIDPDDKMTNNPLITTAIREIREETGLDVGSNRIFEINRCLFSSPGMTDESNGLVCAIIKEADLSELSQAGAVGTEKFDGFVLLNKKEAIQVLEEGKDTDGIFYSVYTWAALMYFVSDMWMTH